MNTAQRLRALAKRTALDGIGEELMAIAEEIEGAAQAIAMDGQKGGDWLESFKTWADAKFGPAPNPDIPQHERYASLCEAYRDGRASLTAPSRPSTGNILMDAFKEVQALKQQSTTEPDTCRKRPRCGLADPCAWLKSRVAEQPVMSEPSNGFVWVAGHWGTAEPSEWRDRLTVNLLRYSSGITKNQIRALIAHAVDGVEPDPALFDITERKGEPVAWMRQRDFDLLRERTVHRPLLATFRPEHEGEVAIYTSPQVPEDHPLMVFAIECEMGALQEHEVPLRARKAIDAARTAR